jgi:hypothetical protein
VSPGEEEEAVTREAIVCDGDAARVRLRRGALCLGYDLGAGRYSVTYGEACAVEGAEVSFTADGRAILSAASTPHRWRMEDVTDALGQGKRLVVEPAESGDPVRWSLSLCLYEQLDALVVAAAVENAADEEIELREARPLFTGENGRLRFGRALKTTRFLADTWVGASGESGLRRVEPGFACESPVTFVLVDASVPIALAGGPLEPPKSFNSFRLELVEEKPPAYRFELVQATPIGCSRTAGVAVAAGATFAPEPILLVFGDSGHAAFERYAECSGKAAGVEKRAVPCGWSSWPYYHANISEAEVLRNVECLEKTLKPYGLHTVLVEAGWQERGDLSGGPWRAGDRFPHGIRWLAQQVREHGLLPGLWIRPLEVDGHRLDPSSGFTHTTLRNEVRRLAEQGALDHLTIDRLHDDAFRRDDSFLPDEAAITALEALRRTVAAVREGFPRFLAAADLTAGAALGLVDANRCAADVPAGNWRLVKDHGVKGLAARYALHGRWWSLDPGCVVVRPPLTLGQARAWASLCALAGGMVVAGDRMDALPAERLDVLKRVMPAYGECARPVDLFEHECPELWSLPVEAGGERWHVVALFNWDTTPGEIKGTRAHTVEQNLHRLRANDAREGRRRPRAALERIASTNRLIRDENDRLRRLMAGDIFEHRRFELLDKLQPMRPSARFKNIVLRFDQLGLEPAQGYLVYDFWDDRFLGLHGERLKVLVRLADCVVLAVRPARGVPQLVSTNRHVTQGGVDLEQIAWNAKRGELTGTSRVVENDEYVAAIYVPHDFEFVSAEADIADVSARHDTPATVRLVLRSLTSKPVRWKLKFNHPA